MALKVSGTIAAVNTLKDAANCRGNVQITLGEGTVNNTTGAYVGTQVATFSIYVRKGVTSPAGQGANWQIKATGVVAPTILEYFFSDYVDIRIVCTTLTTGTAVPVVVVDGQPS